MNNKWYGWIPDKPDFRDRRYAIRAAPSVELPPKVDLRAGMPPVYTQGALGSCTAQAIAAALEFNHLKRDLVYNTCSRLFIYYEERVEEDTVFEDAGACIRNGIKVAAKIGVPRESLWPYEVEKFTQRPPEEAYLATEREKITLYRRIDNSNLNAIKTPLAQNVPVIFGFTVYSAFEAEEVARTGVLHMPQETDKMLGGHAVLATGYDDETKRIMVRNSWGVDWGDGGYFTMPYDYVCDTHLAEDFWCIEAS